MQHGLALVATSYRVSCTQNCPRRPRKLQRRAALELLAAGHFMSHRWTPRRVRHGVLLPFSSPEYRASRIRRQRSPLLSSLCNLARVRESTNSCIGRMLSPLLSWLCRRSSGHALPAGPAAYDPNDKAIKMHGGVTHAFHHRTSSKAFSTGAEHIGGAEFQQLVGQSDTPGPTSYDPSYNVTEAGPKVSLTLRAWLLSWQQQQTAFVTMPQGFKMIARAEPEPRQFHASTASGSNPGPGSYDTLAADSGFTQATKGPGKTKSSIMSPRTHFSADPTVRCANPKIRSHENLISSHRSMAMLQVAGMYDSPAFSGSFRPACGSDLGPGTHEPDYWEALRLEEAERKGVGAKGFGAGDQRTRDQRCAILWAPCLTIVWCCICDGMHFSCDLPERRLGGALLFHVTKGQSGSSSAAVPRRPARP